MRKRVKVIAKYLRWQKFLGKAEISVPFTFDFIYRTPRIVIHKFGKDTRNPYVKKDITYLLFIDNRGMYSTKKFNIEYNCLKNDEFRYLIRIFERKIKEFDIYIIRNYKNKRNYVGKTKYFSKGILENVCRKFHWKEKDCKIRKINIFDYIVRFFCKKRK